VHVTAAARVFWGGERARARAHERERERERERESTTEPPVFEMALHMITASGVKAVSLHPMVWILAPDLFARTPAAVRAPVHK
jgi:hypothetical protein